MALVVADRVAALQRDPQQLQSVGDFVESLIEALSGAGGKPGKALMRELLAPSLLAALEIGGEELKRRFLEALAGNIHQFPLQEQRSLARVHPVEISSEYRNLASFVDDVAGLEDEAAAAGARRAAAIPGTDTGEDLGPLGGLRRRLAALPTRPGAAAADEVLVRLKDGETTIALQAAPQKQRQAFFADLRAGFAKLPEAAQRELCEHFAELRAEVLGLVESMTQEISRWLEEKRHADRRGGSPPSLFLKLKPLFQVVLSPTFLACFKNLGGADKRGKEAFLLKLALCLRAASEPSAPAAPGADQVLAQAGQLRRHFFHVEGYGELMEDWLKSRLKQFNEEFMHRVSVVLSSDTHPVLARLRRTFRPGRWLSLSDAQVEDDIFAVFLDDAFPRHVLADESVARMLRSVSSYAGAACDFQIYGGIARLPPAGGIISRGPPRDAVESAVQQVLQRLPPFPPLRRLRPSCFQFGRLEVEFVIRVTGLMARAQGSHEELPAEEFFLRHGPEQFPAVAALAVQASLQSPHGPPCTGIEDAATTLALPAPLPPQMPASAPPGASFAMGMGLSSLPRAPAPQRYEPYPTMATGTAPGGCPGFPVAAQMLPRPPAPGMKFGLEDDEI